MITADTLKTLTTFTPVALARTLAVSGYTGCSFKSVEFVGITNAGQFAYKVVYFDDSGTGKDEVDKVFLSYDSVAGKITADY